MARDAFTPLPRLCNPITSTSTGTADQREDNHHPNRKVSAKGFCRRPRSLDMGGEAMLSLDKPSNSPCPPWPGHQCPHRTGPFGGPDVAGAAVRRRDRGRRGPHPARWDAGGACPPVQGFWDPHLVLNALVYTSFRMCLSGLLGLVPPALILNSHCGFDQTFNPNPNRGLQKHKFWNIATDCVFSPGYLPDLKTRVALFLSNPGMPACASVQCTNIRSPPLGKRGMAKVFGHSVQAIQHQRCQVESDDNADWDAPIATP